MAISEASAEGAAATAREFTVSELAGAVRRKLETSFGRVRVRGEVSGVREPPSGHVYFCLKDEVARLDVVAWRSVRTRIPGFKDGDGVIVTGSLTGYAERSTYQLVLDDIEHVGIGTLLAKVEALKARLASEGVFREDRKRSLPTHPRVIGVVTSEQGAVIQDIVTTIARRCPCHILLWPIQVQGLGAPDQIRSAISDVDAFASDPTRTLDLLIVARGGGSVEELMPFNDEQVVRAVAACRVPVISAIGHETDTTLVDFAADRRAPTPTAAAELATPSREAAILTARQISARFDGVWRRLMERERSTCGFIARRMVMFTAHLNRLRQVHDDRTLRLAASFGTRHSAFATIVATMISNEEHVRGKVRYAEAGMRMKALQARHAMQRELQVCRADLHDRRDRLLEEFVAPKRRALLEDVALCLNVLSPRALLEKGYALVRDRRGRLITNVQRARGAGTVEILFHDGAVNAAVRSEGQPVPLRGRQLQLDM